MSRRGKSDSADAASDTVETAATPPPSDPAPVTAATAAAPEPPPAITATAPGADAVAPLAVTATPTPSPFAGVEVLTPDEFARLVGAQTPAQLRSAVAHFREQLAKGGFVAGGFVPDQAGVAKLITVIQEAAVPSLIVEVIARRPLAELIAGDIVRFAKGEKFKLPADRAKALGDLVEFVG